MQSVSAVQAKNMGLAAGEMRFVIAAPGRRQESAVSNNSSDIPLTYPHPNPLPEGEGERGEGRGVG